MKAVLSAQAPDVAAPLDPRFGRAAHFVVVDLDTGEWQAYANPAALAGHGAGIEAARFVVDQGVEVAITGATGPNAFRTLDAAGVRVYEAQGGTVSEALEAWRRDELPQVGAPSAPAHAGLQPEASGTIGGGMGGGMGGGQGGGRGMGGGGGAGRGMGGGQGGGRGMGGGGGAGRGMGGGGGAGRGMGGGGGRGSGGGGRG